MLLGVFPQEDQPALEAAGVDQIFTMGADTRDIVAYLENWWAETNEAGSADE